MQCTHSLEDPGTSDPEESRDDPNTFQENYDDINVDHLLNNFQLVCPHFQQMYTFSRSKTQLCPHKICTDSRAHTHNVHITSGVNLHTLILQINDICNCPK